MNGWSDGGWGFLWMILSWGLIVAIVVFVVRAFSSGSSDRRSRAAEPRAILDERFARGEMSEDEYRERRRVLEEQRR
ncbi:MAG TPA: SHOCT domain-containing protein [Actinomycetota bacterium]|nr:SHOCT domain-containing protein [Actinomycetota bacterium]